MRQLISALLMAFALAGLIAAGPGSAQSDAFAGALRSAAETWSLAAICPEPNDERQRACTLDPGADTLGFITGSGDVDMYRFELLDGDASVHLTLSDLPAPYGVQVLDWRGEVVTASERADARTEVARAVLHTPGSYYAVVSSRNGETAEAKSYRLGLVVTYPNSPVRRLVFRDDYAIGVDDWDYRGDTADISRGRGVLSIMPNMTGFPAFGMWSLTHAPADLMVIGDVWVTAGADVDVHLNFGSTYDGSSSFDLLVNTRTGRVALFHHADISSSIIDLPQSAAVDRDGGVNRVVLSSSGDAIRAAVNGQDVFKVTGQRVESGRLSVSAVSWGDPATLTLDNLVVTAEDGPEVTIGSVLLSERFDDPGHQAISTIPTHSASADAAYLDGEYRVRLLSGLDSAIVQLPYNFDFDDAVLSVDVRVVGDPAGRVVMLDCRSQGAGRYRAYGFMIAPEARRFTLVRWDEGAEVRLVPGQESPLIGPGPEWNHLDLRCEGPTIEASVNGQVVATVSDQTYRQGGFAMGVTVVAEESETAQAEARFDNLIVTRR